MQKNTVFIIQKLARKIMHLEQPIRLIAICSGGRAVGTEVVKFLKKNKIDVKYYEVWIDIINGKSIIRNSGFHKKDFKGTAVIIDDVIWQGHQIRPVSKMLRKLNPKKKFFIASILDCNKKADFSVYT